jgi:hypothetical protein
VSDEFHKFPSTPHLATPKGVEIRDDKILSEEERARFLARRLLVEEKIDGANLGLSFDSSGAIRAQNRGEYLVEPFEGQWKKLGQWIDARLDPLFELLGDRLVLFGEWCYARHSIGYDKLPDWFVGFDVFDKEAELFYSAERRNRAFEEAGVVPIPALAEGRFSLDELFGMLETRSAFADAPVEGAYLRYDDGDRLGGRAKIVRADFTQAIDERWSKGGIEMNRLASF